MCKNITMFDKIMALPSWYFNNIMYPFLPKTHLWKKYKRAPPLPIWTEWRTPVTALFDTVFWLCGAAVLILLLNLWLQSIVGT